MKTNEREKLIRFFLLTQDYKRWTTEKFIFELNRFLDGNLK